MDGVPYGGCPTSRVSEMEGSHVEDVPCERCPM